MRKDETRMLKKIFLIFSCLFSLVLIGSYLFSFPYINGISPENDTFNVVINIGLAANFTHQPSNPTPGDVITFTDTSNNSISNSSIINWTWDLGDGSVVSYEKNATHSYSSAGFFLVAHTVTVEKNGSISDTVSKYIAVISNSGPWNPPPMSYPKNRPPSVKINVPTYAHQNQLITYNGTGSFDPDGFIISYRWDFGDGTTGSGLVVTHSYASNGNYTITLIVTDNDGSTSSNSTTIIIAEEKPGFLFDVHLELEPNAVFLGQNITELVTLINVGQPGMVNGTIIYSIYKDGVLVWSDIENVSILGQKAIYKLIPTKGLDVGEYIYEVVYSYGNTTASTHASFTIKPIPPSTSSTKLSPFVLIILLVIVILILIVCVFLFFTRKKRKEVTITLLLESMFVYKGQDINVLIVINSPRWRTINGTIAFSMYKKDKKIWSNEENVSVFRRKEIYKIISTKGVRKGDYICEVTYVDDDGNATASVRASFTINPIQ
jgi:PKD repeat protein